MCCLADVKIVGLPNLCIESDKCCGVTDLPVEIGDMQDIDLTDRIENIALRFDENGK